MLRNISFLFVTFEWLEFMGNGYFCKYNYFAFGVQSGTI